MRDAVGVQAVRIRWHAPVTGSVRHFGTQPANTEREDVAKCGTDPVLTA